MENVYDIRGNEIIEMSDGRSYEVLEVIELKGANGKLKLVEVDEDNRPIGSDFIYTLTISSPIRDIIR